MRVTTARTLSAASDSFGRARVGFHPSDQSAAHGVISFYPHRGYKWLMPKINVYLPDDLADAVRDSGVPVSAICQRALEQAIRRLQAIREVSLSDLDPASFSERLPTFTGRLVIALNLAA